MFKAHRRVYHSTLGWRVIKKKKNLVGIGLDLVLQLFHARQRLLGGWELRVYRGAFLIRKHQPPRSTIGS